MPTATMLVLGKEVTVLSDHERRVWDDIVRYWPEDGVEPDARLRRLPHRWSLPVWDPADLPAWVVAVAVLTVLLIVLGGPVASLGVGLVAVLLWGSWRRQRRGGAATRPSSRHGTGTCGPRA